MFSLLPPRLMSWCCDQAGVGDDGDGSDADCCGVMRFDVHDIDDTDQSRNDIDSSFSPHTHTQNPNCHLSSLHLVPMKADRATP